MVRAATPPPPFVPFGVALLPFLLVPLFFVPLPAVGGASVSLVPLCEIVVNLSFPSLTLASHVMRAIVLSSEISTPGWRNWQTQRA